MLRLVNYSNVKGITRIPPDRVSCASSRLDTARSEHLHAVSCCQVTFSFSCLFPQARIPRLCKKSPSGSHSCNDENTTRSRVEIAGRLNRPAAIPSALVGWQIGPNHAPQAVVEASQTVQCFRAARFGRTASTAGTCPRIADRPAPLAQPARSTS